MHTSLPKYDLVLLGVGHTNAHVLRMWRMEKIANTRLTCVTNFPVATYSGMLPGVLARQYSPDRMQIDLLRLCSAVGARLIVGQITGLDTQRRELLFDDRPPIPFDILSIGIGSVPASDGIDPSNDLLLAIKPMQTFLERLDARITTLLKENRSPIRIIVAGAGAGGVEIAFCLPGHLQSAHGKVPYQLTIVGPADHLIGGVTEKTSRLAAEELRSRGVEVCLGRRVASLSASSVQLDDGTEIGADIVIWATSAAPPPIVSKLGLPTNENGFLLTHPTLQSIGDENIFVVGDTGTIQGQSIPKAGVYAVRQGKILWQNIQRSLRREPLVEYRPQRSFLKLFNMGDGRAIGEYKGITLSGKWVWRLKDRIDSRFMQMYQDYQPRMDAPDAMVSSEIAMRCAGCGGKVSGGVLSRVLSRLSIPTNEHVLIGLEKPDDAAVIRPPTGCDVNLTVDFFAAPFDDPYSVGRIAALNAASDCFAMGASPIAALASATLPVGPAHKQEQLMYELLTGALHEFRPMGATLAGGHTIEGPQLTIGFTMFAAQYGPARTKGSLQPDMALVLTKPLGTGVLLAAHMQARCPASAWQPLLQSMLLSNQYAAQLCERFQVQGITDITGFGLAGHLLEMLRPSGLAAEIDLSQLPLLPGARELFAEGLESTLAPENRAAEQEIEVSLEDHKRPEFAALFDPQTSGGLLIGVPEQFVSELMSQLKQQSDVPAAVIGRTTKYGDGARLRVR